MRSKRSLPVNHWRQEDGNIRCDGPGRYTYLIYVHTYITTNPRALSKAMATTMKLTSAERALLYKIQEARLVVSALKNRDVVERTLILENSGDTARQWLPSCGICLRNWPDDSSLLLVLFVFTYCSSTLGPPLSP